MKTDKQVLKESSSNTATQQELIWNLSENIQEIKTLLEINEHLHHLASLRESGGACLSSTAVSGLITLQHRTVKIMDQNLEGLEQVIRAAKGGAR